MAGLLIGGMVCFGMGNGTVFQLVPQRFAREIGAATGMVGALGGFGGFLLPLLLGNMKQGVGSFGPGFEALAALALTAFVVLRLLVLRQEGWVRSWRGTTAAEAAEANGSPLPVAAQAARGPATS